MDINEAFEVELKKSKIMKGNASRGKKEAIREIAKRFHTAGYKEGRVELAEEINDICKNTDVGGVCILINKKAFLGLIDTELKKVESK